MGPQVSQAALTDVIPGPSLHLLPLSHRGGSGREGYCPQGLSPVSESPWGELWKPCETQPSAISWSVGSPRPSPGLEGRGTKARIHVLPHSLPKNTVPLTVICKAHIVRPADSWSLGEEHAAA